MPRSGWHRVYHPLCGADLATLLRLIAQNGLPSTAGSLRLGIALASSIGRLPFTLAERAWTALAQHRSRPAPPPIFIVGHMRSGTTHLHNLLAASGQFATVPPVVAGMPWEALGLARVLRPFVEQYLPEDRLIDSVRVRSDSPTEDEIALANMHPLSYYHAMYFPRRFRETYRRGLLLEGEGRSSAGRGRCAATSARCRHLARAARCSSRAPAIRRRSAPSARCGRTRGSSTSTAIPTSSSPRPAARCARSCASWPCSLTSMCRSTRPCSIRRLLEEADRLPGNSIVHVRFEELERDPFGQVELIYRSIELDGYEVAGPRIETYLRSIQHYTKATHTFSKESVRRVTQRWQPFIACFGYHQPDLERYAA